MAFLIVGLLLSLVGLLLLVSFVFSRIKCTVETEATVSDVISKSTFWRGKTLWQCTPVFTYYVDGKEYSGKADFSVSDPKKFTVGQSVRIFVNKKSPIEFRCGSNAGIVILGILLLAAGLVLCICFFL